MMHLILQTLPVLSSKYFNLLVSSCKFNTLTLVLILGLPSSSFFQQKLQGSGFLSIDKRSVILFLNLSL